MSSMWRAVLMMPVLLAMEASSWAQYPSPAAYTPAPAYTPSVAASLNQWRQLRASSNYRFSDYAGFLIANPDWPDTTRMRGWAEKAMVPSENPATVLAFFAREKPQTGNGWARLADAYSSTGRAADAIYAARKAWASADLGTADEQAIWARYNASLTRDDHDARVDGLLFDKKAATAARFVPMANASRQAAFNARVAMQQSSPDAEALYRSVIGNVTNDAGLMMDRARYLRANNYGRSAQDLAARTHHFSFKPADPQRFYEMLMLIAQDAASAGNWSAVYHITRQIDDVLPPGAQVPDQALGIRDDYTSLAWLGGTAALQRINQPSAAIAMFDRYARAGRSLQVQTKGYYWAGRAALGAGQVQTANAYFQRAAAYPDLFYGQLALERVGRSVPMPASAMPQYGATSVQQAAFNSRRLVQALRTLQQQGRSTEEAMFVQALARSLDTDVDRNLALQLAQQLRRQDIPVWVARMARIKGSSFYVQQAYPTLSASVTPSLWSLAHGISRQESSFDPYAISHAGARGTMQLMPGTAREQAGKMGLSYDSYRLLTDPNYNVQLGSAYFQRMMNIWDGNVPLAVASYNAGSGNAGKWVRRFGDPRGNVDVISWIEAIPFEETRGYVQRVIENSVVYDAMRGGQPQQSAMHVSRYLGKNRPG